MVPNGRLPPHPLPASVQSLLPGGKPIRKIINVFDDFLWILWIIKKLIQIVYWVKDGTNVGPYCPHPPIPIPGVSKSLLPGVKQIRKTHTFDDVLWCLWKSKKKLPGGLKRGPWLKGNPTVTTSTVTTRRKGDPQHYVEGKSVLKRKIWNQSKINQKSTNIHHI